jgi:hypothetical protein
MCSVQQNNTINRINLTILEMVIMGDYSSPCDRNILQQSPKKMPKTCFQDGIDGCLIMELPHISNISIYFQVSNFFKSSFGLPRCQGAMCSKVMRPRTSRTRTPCSQRRPIAAARHRDGEPSMFAEKIWEIWVCLHLVIWGNFVLPKLICEN